MKRYAYILFYTMAVGLLIGLVLRYEVETNKKEDINQTKQSDALKQIHKEYNWVKVFEDGSYSLETLDGEIEHGFIEDAPCTKKPARQAPRQLQGYNII